MSYDCPFCGKFLGLKELQNWTVAYALSGTLNTDAVQSLTEFYLEAQEEGGFAAFSSEYPGAIGQGETEEEAVKDLQAAISVLKEVLDEERCACT